LESQSSEAPSEGRRKKLKSKRLEEGRENREDIRELSCDKLEEGEKLGTRKKQFKLLRDQPEPERKAFGGVDQRGLGA